MIIYNSRLANILYRWRGFSAITFWPFIFVEAFKINEESLNHEKIHLRQQAELLVIGFYVLYVISFLFGFFKYHSFIAMYRNNIFEREAYEHQDDNDYLLTRRFWAWLT